MENFSLPKRLYLAYLGRALAATYYSQHRKFLRVTIRSWIKWLSFAAFMVALLFRLGATAVLLTLFIFLWIQFSYWRAGRMGFSKFVVDDTAVLPVDKITLIPAEEKMRLHASGTFALSTRDNSVFMHPAEYWRSGLGEHVVMVQETKTRFLYQFFTAATVQKIEKGWSVFGKEPIQTLAVTIDDTWGPAQNNNAIAYYVGGGPGVSGKQKARAIYFTFEEEAMLLRVWGSLVADMGAGE